MLFLLLVAVIIAGMWGYFKFFGTPVLCAKCEAKA